MTLQTESAHVTQVAFAAALCHRHNVIGIPKRLAAFESPGGQRFQPAGPAQAPKVGIFDDAVGTADSANSFISFKYPCAQMTGVRA
jgi:hypothetical protein